MRRSGVLSSVLFRVLPWIVACLAAGPACAAVKVFGSGYARQCYDAAAAGHYDRAAIHLCDLALEDDSLIPADRGGTLVNRGVMRLHLRDYVQAQVDLDSGVAMNPQAGDGWLDRGAAKLALHHDRAALTDINRAISLGVHEPEKAYYDRAIAEERLDDEKAAYFDYQRAAEIKPGWELPIKELSRFTVSTAP